MSRIGKMPIVIPKGVEIELHDSNMVTVKGPLGSLTCQINEDITVKVENPVITLKRSGDSHFQKALHGLTRSLLRNMVKGVSEGFSKRLEIVGVGYRAQLQEKRLVMNLGYSHPVVMNPPVGITVELPTPTQIVVKGADKQLVGEFASQIRQKRKPEPYLGKGIKYADETIRRKEGKKGA